MHKAIFAAAAIFVIAMVPAAFAETKTEKIITECETIYPELETLGKAKFLQRYMHNPNIRSCLTLFNDIVWFSDDSDRTEKLIALLGGPIIEKPVRDRFEKTETVPQWIKDDATRWHQGKERDNIFSYGIRYMINSKMIDSPIIVIDQPGCVSDQICVAKNHYIKYSIKDSQSQDIANLTHTFGTPGSTIAISSVEVTKDDKSRDNFHIDSDGYVDSSQEYYRYAHVIPIKIGSQIHSVYDIKATSELIFPFKNQKRDAILAWDKTKQYQEVIDKNTGIVLFAKYSDRIKKTEWVSELTDTNAFTEEITIQYDGMRIPSWFKSPVKWWTEGKVSDSEYLAGITFLLKNDIMQI